MEWEIELAGAIERSIQKIPDGTGVLFSGGLDSSFIAFLAKKIGRKVNLYSSGTSNSHDKEQTIVNGKLVYSQGKYSGLNIDEIRKKNEEIFDRYRSLINS